MKRIVLLTFTLVVCSSFMYKPESKVYICKGKYSKKYHYDKSCRGLKNCSTDVYEVTLDEAKKMGRTLCGWED